MTDVVEPINDVSTAGEFIAGVVLELQRYVLPPAVEFVREDFRGMHGGYAIVFEDGASTSMVVTPGEPVNLDRMFCSLCGSMPDGESRYHWRWTLEHATEGVLATYQRTLCVDCHRRQNHEQQAKDLLQWNEELKTRLANLLLQQKIAEWRRLHPVRMAPFR